MTFQVIPYQPQHLFDIDLQGPQKLLGEWITPDQAKNLVGKYSFTGLHEGSPIVCAGVVELWHGRFLTWAYLDRRAGCCFMQIHGAVRSFLNTFKGERIEAAVDCDFQNGHRWVRALDFKLEAERMAKFLPNGKDCSLYARI